MNVITLGGKVGQDPEFKTLDSGVDIVEFSLATNHGRKKGDEYVQETVWHRCKVIGKRAKTIRDYVTKGSSLVVTGRQENRKWEDKEGNRRTSPEVFVTDFDLMGGKRSDTAKDAQSATTEPTRSVPNMAPTFDTSEDVPF